MKGGVSDMTRAALRLYFEEQVGANLVPGR
jgi:hypothetical protein